MGDDNVGKNDGATNTSLYNDFNVSVCMGICKRRRVRVIVRNVEVRVGFNDSPDSSTSFRLFQSPSGRDDCATQITKTQIHPPLFFLSSLFKQIHKSYTR